MAALLFSAEEPPATLTDVVGMRLENQGGLLDAPQAPLHDPWTNTPQALTRIADTARNAPDDARAVQENPDAVNEKTLSLMEGGHAAAADVVAEAAPRPFCANSRQYFRQSVRKRKIAGLPRFFPAQD